MTPLARSLALLRRGGYAVTPPASWPLLLLLMKEIPESKMPFCP